MQGPHEMKKGNADGKEQWSGGGSWVFLCLDCHVHKLSFLLPCRLRSPRACEWDTSVCHVSKSLIDQLAFQDDKLKTGEKKKI